MNLSEVCASAYSQKAVMDQLCLLAPTISEFGQERSFANHARFGDVGSVGVSTGSALLTLIWE